MQEESISMKAKLIGKYLIKQVAKKKCHHVRDR